MLVGVASSNVHDGNKDMGDGLILKGIPSQSEIGFLTFYEHFGFKWTTTGKKYDEVFHIDETNVNEHFIMVYKL